MHLLAAQPGGFVEEEGIIDLNQDPAVMVILAAADTSLAMLATAAEQLGDELPSLRLANWSHLLKPAAFDLYEHKVLDQAQLVVVSLLGGESYWHYGFERLQAWQKAKPGRQLVLVPGDDAEDPALTLASSCAAQSCQQVWQYLRQGGVGNGINLLRFLHQELLQELHQKLKQDGLFESAPICKPPAELPQALIYQPGIAQASLADWRKSTSDKGLEQAPVVTLLFYRSHLQSGNTRMFDGLIEALIAQGLNPIALAITSLKDAQALALVNHTIKQTNTKLVLSSLGFSSNKVDAPSLSSSPTQFSLPIEGNIPVLQLVLSSTTQEAWREHKQGLRSRDIAMQVVLPEMDGHVLTRAISFKSMGYYSERCQIDLVGYEIEADRALFVARLAAAYCQLGQKANADKRIALILANYPTKDGRIGNGVGLDTPQSAINVLQAMQDAGYPIDKVPENGNALIEALMESVTNNPNTLHHLPCWQSLDVSQYLEHFRKLPKANQEAVLQRWGAPEQDPKYRQEQGKGRIMLAGLRLGETFVGIQPARGYNLDLTANYHDPDLVPPHSYLAFYFWLRNVYQVDAIIHLGKHGNLEWLPGKGVALSDECWPDVALGPMPHFYPFIVNDPGEGAQAKRRAQAVIIDHLMPPMARAETYGELADLENLVDELYQATGLDTGREQWLREQIVATLASSHLKEELGLSPNACENDMLTQLDTYLCDIKEAQIRNGLHILGELPKHQELSETMVALLRLPRGEADEERGILHSLALDLGLLDYDPLASQATPWQGAQPALLAQQSDSPWRTSMDTRERLELLALSLVNEHLLCAKPTELSVINDSLPRTRALLSYAKDTILTALEESVQRETQALIDGLAGQAIEPGPSGAPTRGRLDTLPTGRNFFSLDNRSVPSAAAWALGQKSAQALIERHLQEHGDYPRQLGLSVWGTATMRTGGDDIAQAFALMGVKPIWAPGSQRVTDFEVIPAMQLGRPRVDVTLRVSGFFRDAFPNVMKLYDAAVQAIAAYDDPGDGNSIRLHIEQRQAELEDQGMGSEEAYRQASYRVYGSKPGAYGAGLQGLIDERCWGERADLAEAYLNWGGYAYGYKLGGDEPGANQKGSNQISDGVPAHASFKHRLSQLEAVVQNQDNREHDLLDSDDYYQFQGGMTNAVTSYSGKAPAVYHSDHSNPSAPKIRTLSEELNRVLRSRVLNPKWIGAMRRHGYKGAFEMAASVDYLFAYDATTDLIADYQYQQVSDALIFDPENQQFMRDNNPAALEEMTERMLEACQRGMWQEPGEHQQALQNLLLDLDIQQENAS